MAIGHPEIDKQHERLFLLGETAVESLTNSDEKNLVVAELRAFIVFAQEHFKYEENLMRLSGYPEADRHARDHASLLMELIGHCTKVQWGQSTNPESMTAFLWNWLILHIDIADRELVAWLKSREPKGSSHRISDRSGPAEAAAP